MILDFVSPWSAALEANDDKGIAAFRRRHRQLLSDLQRQRDPLDPLQLTTDHTLLRSLASHASSPALHAHIERVLADATRQAGLTAIDVVLLAGTGRGGIIEPLPWMDPPAVVVFVEHAHHADQVARRIASSVVRGAALVTRWEAADSASPLRRTGDSVWDRWLLSRDVPLAEWIYADGVASQLALALDPAQPVHEVIGVSHSAFVRLRERERQLRALLMPDLELSGLGPMLRWMTPDAPAEARRAGRAVIPAGAGSYLAMRLTEARVRSVGIRAAIRAVV